MPSIDALPFPDYQQSQVLAVLRQAALNELLTCTLYQQVEQSIPRYTHPDLIRLAANARKEDWDHYEVLLGCIEYITPSPFLSDTHQPSGLVMPPTAKSAADLLGQIEKAEQNSIAFQQQICAMTLGYDYRIFDHAYALLNENMQHNEKVNDWLKRAA